MDGGKKEYRVIVENEDAAQAAFWWSAPFGRMALAIARERGLLDVKEGEEIVQGKAQDFG